MLEAVYHGHSFVELRDWDSSLLIDPFITGNSLCDCSVAEIIESNPSIIIITHGHFDHIWDSVEIAKATSATVVATYELIEWMKQQWVENCSPHHIWWRADYDWCSIKFTPALHGGQIMDSAITTTPAWVLVTIWSHTIHHMGDTWLTKEFELLGEYENISLSFVPIGDRFTMWVDDALIALSMIKPKYVVPVHYNTWDPIKADTDRFAREVMQQWNAVPKILKPGQMVVFE